MKKGVVCNPNKAVWIMTSLRRRYMVMYGCDGNKLEGRYNPSSVTATHLRHYKAFPDMGGIVHTHYHGRQAGHRQEEEFLAMEQPMRIICAGRFLV